MKNNFSRSILLFSVILILIISLTPGVYALEKDKVKSSNKHGDLILSDSIFESIEVEKSRGHIKTNFSDYLKRRKRKLKYSVAELKASGILYPAIYINGSPYLDWRVRGDWLLIDFICCSDIVIEINNTGFISIIESISIEGGEGSQTAIPNFNLQSNNVNMTFEGITHCTNTTLGTHNCSAGFNTSDGDFANHTENITVNSSVASFNMIPKLLTGANITIKKEGSGTYIYTDGFDDHRFIYDSNSSTDYDNLSVTTSSSRLRFATSDHEANLTYKFETPFSFSDITISKTWTSGISTDNIELWISNDTITWEMIDQLLGFGGSDVTSSNDTTGSSNVFYLRWLLKDVNGGSADTHIHDFAFNATLDISTSNLFTDNILNFTHTISSNNSERVTWGIRNVYNLSFIEVTVWADQDADGWIDDVEYNYTVCENETSCNLNGSVTHRIENSSLESGTWRSFSDGVRIGTPSISNGLLILYDPPVNSMIRATKPQERLWLITEMIIELTPLLDALADTIPAIIRIVIMFGLGALVVGLFAAIVLMIRQMVINYKGD